MHVPHRRHCAQEGDCWLAQLVPKLRKSALLCVGGRLAAWSIILCNGKVIGMSVNEYVIGTKPRLHVVALRVCRWRAPV